MKNINWYENWLITMGVLVFQIVAYWGITGNNPGLGPVVLWAVLNMAVGCITDYATNR